MDPEVASIQRGQARIGIGRFAAYLLIGALAAPFVTHGFLSLLGVPQDLGYIQVLIFAVPVGAVIGALLVPIERLRGYGILARPLVRGAVAALVYIALIGVLTFAAYGIR